MILQTLYQQCIKNEVAFFDEYLVIDVVLDGRRCLGVIALDLATGELHSFSARAVLFATGGFGRMFRITSNAYANTGDGPAVLARAGVPLQDMEFFQFHPTGIRNMGILITEGVRGEGGILRNRRGEAFMEEYAPTLLDLAPRDMVSRAILTEIRGGRGIKGDGEIDDYVHLDATHLGREVIEAKLPDIADFCRTYMGIDPSEEPIPVQPTAHYAMGGIPTDIHGRVTTGQEMYEGLYAAGECACVSVHGANRLGTNSLVDLIVFGRQAGQHINRYVGEADSPGLPKDADGRARRMIEKLRVKERGPHPGSLFREMQSLMMNHVGIYRNEKEMTEALAGLSALRQQYGELRVQDPGAAFNTEIQEILELGNLLDLAWMTSASSLNRRESRGAHSREDYQERDDANWLKHTLVRFKNLEMDYRTVDIRQWKPKPRTY